MASVDDGVDPPGHLLFDTRRIQRIDDRGWPARLEPALQPGKSCPHQPRGGDRHHGQSDEK
jgi:hypothetical protein